MTAADRKAASIERQTNANARKLAYLESKPLTTAERAEIAKAQQLPLFPCGHALTQIAAPYARADILDLAAKLDKQRLRAGVRKTVERARLKAETVETDPKMKHLEAVDLSMLRATLARLLEA